MKNRIAVGGGVIDPDYDGEVKVILFNHGDEDFIVKPGDRIAQLVLERVMLIDASIVPRKVRRRTDRGSAGFGSTGKTAAATIGSDGKSFEFSIPRGEISLSHRPKNSGAFPPLYACVARPVNKKEQAGNANTKAALQKEWDKLTSQGCWDLSTVQEWFDFAARARKEGEKIHVGRCEAVIRHLMHGGFMSLHVWPSGQFHIPHQQGGRFTCWPRRPSASPGRGAFDCARPAKRAASFVTSGTSCALSTEFWILHQLFKLVAEPYGKFAWTCSTAPSLARATRHPHLNLLFGIFS